MLNQLGFDSLSYFITYIPTIFKIAIYIIILLFAVFIFKRNSYRYGITLMISAILMLISDILYIAIQYPYLSYRLHVELGLSVYEVAAIMIVWSYIFLSLNMSSSILLGMSIYMVYKTHKTGRNE